MQLILHTGVHFTEDERIMKCLLRNAENFSAQGVSVPGPGRYRRLIRDTLNAMAKGDADEDARDILMDAILDDNTADRLILSDSHLFRIPPFALVDGVLYPWAPERMARMKQLFAQDDIEIFMAIRNPAGLLPVLFEKAQKPEKCWGLKQPQDILWSDMIGAMRRAVPDVPITVWCNEDAPLIWSQVIREMAGLDYSQKIIGSYDLLSSIMSVEGMEKFRGLLKKRPNMTEVQLRGVMMSYLEQYVIEEEIEEELDMPGWSDELVQELTEIYDDDLWAIERIPGVRVISP